MLIGVIKGNEADKRVALIPDSVRDLLKLKVEVVVEKDAGQNAFIDNKLFEEAGATIQSRKDVLKKADLILSVTPPAEKEIDQLNDNQACISVFNPLWDIKQTQKLAEKGKTIFSLDLVPRITRAQSMDVLSSMATVAGYKAVLDAANHLPKFFPMFMTAAGTIKPAKVLILGAGVAGLQAIATSRKLGAVVEVFDVRSAVKEEVESLGGKFIEVEGAREEASSGGYAVEQDEEFKARQAKLIHDHALKSNVIIATAQIPGKKAPLLIKKETVQNMNPGTVIIDLAASTGGNCELSKSGKIINEKGVTIIGKSNYPDEMPNDASLMFGKNAVNFIKLLITEEGTMHLNMEDEVVKQTCMTHQSEIISDRVKSLLNQ